MAPTRWTPEEIHAALDNAVEARAIYNVDFIELKYQASKRMELDQVAVQKIYLDVDYEDRNEVDGEIYYNIGYSPVQGPSRKFANFVAAAPAGDVKTAALAFVKTWAPIAVKFKEIKPFVIKGRKPSDTPRKTPERTIENTGTCPVCGQNVKLKDGQMVSHGYQVRWNQFVGNCFGVREQALEVSDSGLRNYLNLVLIPTQADLTKQVTEHEASELNVPSPWRRGRFIDPGEEGYDRARHSHIERTKNDIKFIGKDIETFRVRIQEWKATKLPG